MSATGCWARAAAWRTEATTPTASLALTRGPGGTNRAPVALANSQSTGPAGAPSVVCVIVIPSR